jgi:hypothetical protein
LSQWRLLLDKTARGLKRLRTANRPVPDWALGGGTALMIHTGHRISKDIDVFIDDAQYLSFLSPRLGGEDIWACDAFDEATHHLKLIFPEGEIDFIVDPIITGLPSTLKTVEGGDVRQEVLHEIPVEHPVEVALKKLNHRGHMLKVRDIFDIAVVDVIHPKLLRENLFHVAHLKSGVLARLRGIPKPFAQRELAELDISQAWLGEADTCLARVQAMIQAIPEPIA